VLDGDRIAEIRFVYRKLAKKYHPGRNVSEQGMAEQFKLVAEASTFCQGKEQRPVPRGMIGMPL